MQLGMPEMVGPFNGRGKQRVPFPPKLGLYQVGATLSRDELVGRAYLTNGGLVSTGDTMDALIARGTALVGVVVDEKYSSIVFDSLSKIYSQYYMIAEAMDSATIRRTRAMDVFRPAMIAGKMQHWESQDYDYYGTDMVTWMEMLSKMQMIYTKYTRDRPAYIADDDKPTLANPMTREILVGLAQYEQKDGYLNLQNRPSRRFRFGKWEPLLHITKNVYEAKELRTMAPYIGALAYGLRTAYGDLIIGSVWEDWCALASWIIYSLRPGGSPGADPFLVATDIAETILDYIGFEISEAYRFVGVHDGWMFLSIITGFAVLRQGVRTTEFNLVKQGGPGSPYQMRGEIAWTLDKLQMYNLPGMDTPFLPPARNHSPDRILFPCCIEIDVIPNHDACELNPIWQKDIGTPVRVDIRRNEAAMGTLDIGPTERKELRWVPQPDTRMQIFDTDNGQQLLIRLPTPEDEPYKGKSRLDTLFAKLTGGEAHMKYGYYMSPREVTPYVSVTFSDGTPGVQNTESGIAAAAVQPADGAMTQPATPPPVVHPPVTPTDQKPGVTQVQDVRVVENGEKKE